MERRGGLGSILLPYGVKHGFYFSGSLFTSRVSLNTQLRQTLSTERSSAGLLPAPRRSLLPTAGEVGCNGWGKLLLRNVAGSAVALTAETR